MRSLWNILRRWRYPLAVGIVALGVLALPTRAFAQPPNDNFSSATLIPILPFSDVVNTTGATTELAEPQFCNFMSQTVWYSFTPTTTEVVTVDNIGTGFATDLNVYQQTGSGFAGLSFIGCSQNPNPAIFTAQAGTTYYIQTGILFGAAGDLHLNLHAVPPPPNDDFVSATTIGSLPYSNTVDTTAATIEAGEPTPACATFFNPTGSVWYSFTPFVSETVSTNIQAFFGSTVVAAYSGSSLSNLSELGSACFGGTLSVHLSAGTTYYFQAAGLFGGRGPLTLNLFATPPPTASFFFSPSDPSIFDTVQFTNNSTDPGELGFQSATWDFGDGSTTTTTSNPVAHQYAKDGDYTVELTVTTIDGRTASNSQIVHVKTHDVSIARVLVPVAASVGQTRTITVGIRNTRYPETVQVQLFKSTTTGFSFSPIGTVTHSVPVVQAGRTTDFSFNYTFKSDDATVGKVSFEAVATIIGARDALPADNTAISLPTKINP